jgi:hypothetical protein
VHRAHNITFVVPNVRKMIWGCRMMELYSETGLHEKRLMRTLFIETVLEGCESFALFSQALAGGDAVFPFNVRCSRSCLPF